MEQGFEYQPNSWRDTIFPWWIWYENNNQIHFVLTFDIKVQNILRINYSFCENNNYVLVPGFEVNPAEWNAMMDNIDLNDPGQREMAGFITGKFAMVKGSDGDGNSDGDTTDSSNDTQIFPRTTSEQQDYDRQMLEV